MVTPQPPGPADDSTLKARVAELKTLLAMSKASEATTAAQLGAAKTVIAETGNLIDKIRLDANAAENALERVLPAAKRMKVLVA